MNEHWILVKPVPISPHTSEIDRRRLPRSGPKVVDTRTIEIRAFKESLGLTTKEIALRLAKFDGIPTSAETMQAYFQGYVTSDELIDKMILRVRAYLAHQSPAAMKFAKMTMVDIMDDWFKQLKIKRTDPGCPWRKLGSITDKTHSTLFRWYQENRKPRSVETIIAMDKTIKSHLGQQTKNH